GRCPLPPGEGARSAGEGNLRDIQAFEPSPGLRPPSPRRERAPARNPARKEFISIHSRVHRRRAYRSVSKELTTPATKPITLAAGFATASLTFAAPVLIRSATVSSVESIFASVAL